MELWDYNKSPNIGAIGALKERRERGGLKKY